MTEVSKDLIFIILGALGGAVSLLLHVKKVGSDYWKKPDFWVVFIIDLSIVMLAGIPIAWLLGSYIEQTEYAKTMYIAAYASSVLAKDIIKYGASTGIERVVSIMTGKS